MWEICAVAQAGALPSAASQTTAAMQQATTAGSGASNLHVLIQVFHTPDEINHGPAAGGEQAAALRAGNGQGWAAGQPTIATNRQRHCGRSAASSPGVGGCCPTGQGRPLFREARVLYAAGAQRCWCSRGLKLQVLARRTTARPRQQSSPVAQCAPASIQTASCSTCPGCRMEGGQGGGGQEGQH